MEPRSTPGLCAALTAPTPRDWRGESFGPDGRSLCTWARGHDRAWIAYPLLGSPEDAPELAAAIDRSTAIGVDGSPGDVEPLIPYLRRAGELHRFRNVVAAPGQEFTPPTPDPRTRLATRLDLPALYELFDGYEVAFARHRRARHRALTAAVERMGAIVIDGPGRLDAAAVSEGFTPNYLVWSHLRVHPDARERGLQSAIRTRMLGLLAVNGLGVMVTLSDSNRVTVPEDVAGVEVLCALNMSLPDRLPGEAWVRRQAWRVGRRLDALHRPGR